jgi:hypothetical protein
VAGFQTFDRGRISPFANTRTNRLIFNVDQSPASFPLFDVRGRDQVKEIAALLKRQWAGAMATGAGGSAISV